MHMVLFRFADSGHYLIGHREMTYGLELYAWCYFGLEAALALYALLSNHANIVYQTTPSRLPQYFACLTRLLFYRRVYPIYCVLY